MEPIIPASIGANSTTQLIPFQTHSLRPIQSMVPFLFFTLFKERKKEKKIRNLPPATGFELAAVGEMKHKLASQPVNVDSVLYIYFLFRIVNKFLRRHTNDQRIDRSRVCSAAAINSSSLSLSLFIQLNSLYISEEERRKEEEAAAAMVLSKTASQTDVSVHSTFASRYVRDALPRYNIQTSLSLLIILYMNVMYILYISGVDFGCRRIRYQRRQRIRSSTTS